MTLDRLDNPRQSYRVSFSTLFLWTVVALLVLDNARTLIVEGVSFEDIVILRNLSLITIFSLLNSGILVWLLKSEISVEGISSFNSWGAADYVAWNQIVDARILNFLGLGYYRITSHDGRRIYVARYLSRQREFEAIVAAITAKGNPLRLCIEDHRVFHEE